jgi:manganese efflux pump family protein
MELLTLVVWLATAVGGFALLAVWIQHGGMGDAAQRRFSKPLPLLHGGTAVISLILFLIYWLGDVSGLREVVLAGLLVTAVLGFAMFGKWLAGVRRRPAHSVGAARVEAPEDSFPKVLVVIHGIAAVATLVLYLAAAYVVAT